MRVADAGGRQEGAQGRRGRDAAGEVMRSTAGVGRLRDLPDDLTPRGGIALAGLAHAGPDQLLEMLALGHCPLSFSGREADPTRPASRRSRSERTRPVFPSRTAIPFASAAAGRRRRPVRRSGVRWRAYTLQWNRDSGKWFPPGPEARELHRPLQVGGVE